VHSVVDVDELHQQPVAEVLGQCLGRDCRGTAALSGRGRPRQPDRSFVLGAFASQCLALAGVRLLGDPVRQATDGGEVGVDHRVLWSRDGFAQRRGAAAIAPVHEGAGSTREGVTHGQRREVGTVDGGQCAELRTAERGAMLGQRVEAVTHRLQYPRPPLHLQVEGVRQPGRAPAEGVAAVPSERSP
jgi:hypothetical protein